MKKAVLILGIFGFTLCFTSCKKEVIEIVDQQEELNLDLRKSTSDGNGLNADNFGNVTDPNEDEDFDSDKKNNIGNGK